jgi:glycosyltransferase involved in cell wall biosynthesis
MISPGHNGYLFPVGDTGAYVDRLAVLADRGVSARMGRNARLVVQALFAEKTMVDRYEKVLLELCVKPLRQGEPAAG